MTGKKKKPVEDDPMLAYLRKRAELDRRIAKNQITLDEVNYGLQMILDRECELTWKDDLDEKTKKELIKQLRELIFAIANEVSEAGEGIVVIAEWEGSKMVAKWHGLCIHRPNDPVSHNIHNLDHEIWRYKPELRDLRKILRGLRNKKKAKATA